MPTENPKISAYVPQVVYDRFKQFQEERKLSMSQAATELIAEYFGINLKEEITSQSTSGLPERLAQVEKDMEELRDLYERLALKIEYKESTSELQENTRKDDSSIDNSSSSLQSEPPGNTNEIVNSSLLSSPQNEPLDLQQNSNHIQMELVPSLAKQHEEQVSELQEELQGEPPIFERIELDHKLITERLGVSEKYMHSQKKLDIEDFAKWTSKKDPDGIPWKFAKNGSKVIYYPFRLLNGELQSKLSNWLIENQSTVNEQ